MTDAIYSMLNENRTFPPPENISAHIPSMQAYRDLRKRFDEDMEGTWGQLAKDHLTWRTPFLRVLNDEKAPFFRWFDDGEMNVSENCLDRHVDAGLGERTAIIWEGEPGDVRRISYQELLADVCRAANALKALGVERDDRVVIYMPMIPEAAIAMLACTRIGATHSVVFGAFSAQALKERIEDAGAKIVITADGGWRRGKVHALKPNVDEALSQGCSSIRHVLMVRRGGNDVEMQTGRDIEWAEALAVQADQCEAVALPSEHPLLILYTSGSTGKPRESYILQPVICCGRD